MVSEKEWAPETEEKFYLEDAERAERFCLRNVDEGGRRPALLM